MIEEVLETLKGIFPRVLVVTKKPRKFRFLGNAGAEIVRDRYRAGHALGGLYSGLIRVRTRHAFVCACDMPLLKPELVKSLWRLRVGRMAVAPRFGGFLQPLCAVYARDCRPRILELIRENRLGMREMLRRIGTRIMNEKAVRKADRRGLSFLDIDTKRDYRLAVSRAEGGKEGRT